MTHWEVVWACFGLTIGALLLDFWQAHQAAKHVRNRLLLAQDEDRNRFEEQS